jgi:alpha-tubulin suppressor-like RCC1 family protein/HEAT repeat protein/pectate lyase
MVNPWLRYLMCIGVSVMLLAAFTFDAAFADENNIPAFPGAEGFGAKSIGGRGGKVLKVTNLNSKGPGSFTAACAAEGPRIIVFDVSGVIEGNVRITGPNITIAGQTAPGAGITLEGRLMCGGMRSGSHDIIIRFLRCRPSYGISGGGSGDCTQLGGTQRLILDHLSVSGATDESMDFCGSKDFTVQWCAIEASRVAYEGSGQHNYGMIMGYTAGDATLHHNLFAHHSERAPLCGLDTLDHRNNVIYNVASAIQYHPIRMNRRKRMYRLNLVGCYFKDGPAGPIGARPWLTPLNQAEPGIHGWKNVQVYGKNNYWTRTGKYHDYDPKLEATTKLGSKYRTDEQWKVAPVTTHKAEEAYRLVMAQVGCLPRDAISKRTIREVHTGTGYWGTHMPAGGLMEGLNPGKTPKDSDGDGMPDEWETAHKLNPNDASDNNKIVPAGASKDDRHKGYTWIEYYINELADKLVEDALANVEKIKAPAGIKRAAVAAEAGKKVLRAGPAPTLRAPLAAGAGQTTVIKDTHVWAWGLNWRGELGNGTDRDSSAPVLVKEPDGAASLKNLLAVVSDGAHVAALRENGTVLCWGFNQYGQVGIGTTADKQILPTPVKGPGGKDTLDGVSTIAAGGYHTLAVRSGGTVWAWGCNMDGRLGDGTTTDRHTPVEVKGLTSVVAVSAGVKHSLALRADGTVWAWGDNLYGELGDGTVRDSFVPVKVSGLSGVKAVAAGWHHSIALKKDSTVWAWGCNHFGQLGDGTELDRKVPVQVRNLTDVKAIAAGGLHNLAIKEDGTLWAWGWNYRGQLGDGSLTDRSTPVQVKGPYGKGFLQKVAVVDGGGAHSAVLVADGTLLVWGDNFRGQIGNGTIGITWALNGEFFDHKTAMKKKLHTKGAIKVPGPPWPTVIALPSLQETRLIQELARIGPDSQAEAPKVIGHLSAEAPRLRCAAVAALGRIGPKTEGVVDALVRTLGDREQRVRLDVIKVFTGFDPASAGLIPALVGVLDDKDYAVRRAAIKALGNFKEAGAEAAPAIWAIAERGREDGLSGEAFDMLSLIGAAAEPMLSKALVESKDPFIRTRAALTLAYMGVKGVKAIPALIKALDDTEMMVRKHSAWALSKMGPAAKEAIPALKKVLNDQDPGVRANAKAAIKKIEGGK